jgi:hypothetical protein
VVAKLFCIVEYDFSWDSEVADDDLPEKLLNCCGVYVSERFCLDLFGEIFNFYDDESVVALSWSQWAYYAYSPLLNWS